MAGTTRFALTPAATFSEGAIPSDVEVLILGGLGQVGEALVAAAGAAGRDRDAVRQIGRGDADIVDAQAVDAALAARRPRLVINCAVFQPVDLCETEPASAFAVNAIGAGNVAASCRRHGARLMHVSTDYVFGGERRRPYRESDLPMPQNLYGVSKLAGEHLVLAASETNTVVRTSGVYGTAQPGHGTAPFIQRMLERARAGTPTRVVRDQIISPTSAADLAARMWELAACGATGVFHVANRGAASWFEIAEIAFEAVGARSALRPITAAEFGAPAPRAAYTALESERAAGLGLGELRGWRDALRDHLLRLDPELILTA